MLLNSEDAAQEGDLAVIFESSLKFLSLCTFKALTNVWTTPGRVLRTRNLVAVKTFHVVISQVLYTVLSPCLKGT